MNKIRLQAHKGVASECPENTLSAFRLAILQEYDVIELDLGYTLDKKIVVLHDNSINRTARFNNKKIEEKTYIYNLSYSELDKYDFGIWFSNKFKDEKIPLFKDVLKLAKENNIRLKIDNKIQAFPKEILDIFFSEIESFSDCISITSNNLEFIRKCLNKNNKIAIDYDGEVTEDVLKELSEILPNDKLTVWLPYECKNTSWVKIPFASNDLVNLVKKYAHLGIWLISDYSDYIKVVEEFSPDIVETDGTIKPIKNSGIIYDMHTHSKNSHDSKCEVREMASIAKERKIKGIAVTDHCDVEYFETLDLKNIINGSIKDATSIKDNSVEVLKGIEVGEAIWNLDVTKDILKSFDFDVVIGSIHAVRYEGLSKPYSRIDFSNLEKEVVLDYLKQYFIDMKEMIMCCDIDILAHLTCPFRYINGKYSLNISPILFKDEIKEILEYIIKHKICLEVNTSCIYENSKYNSLMPEEWIIELYKEMGGYLISLASDAHIASNCANNFMEVVKVLKEIGFKYIYYYKDRYPIQCFIK